MLVNPHPKALRVARRASALATLGVAAALLVAAFTIPPETPWRWVLLGLVAAVVLFSVVDIAVLEPRMQRSIRYELLDDRLELHQGVLVERSRVVPYRQVLVVERRQGPLLRAEGLVAARLRLPEGQVDVVGIDEDAFEAIQAAIMDGISS